MTGCNGNDINKCTTPVSSNCVKMQNETDEYSCQGDNLTEVVDVIKERLNALSEGKNILDISFDCDFLASQMVGKEITLFNVISTILSSLCSINGEIEDVQALVNAPISYDLKCLPSGANTTPQVVQSLINKLCTIATEVSNISTQLNNQGSITTTINNTAGNFIKQAITSCTNEYGITKSGSGENVSISIDNLVPPCTALWVWDSAMLSFFDATGKGKINTPFCSWLICNGLNGTPNMFGYVPAQATSLPGIQGSLDSRVVSNTDVSYSANIGDKKGEVKHKLIEAENASHTHIVIDNGHSHSITLKKNSGTTSANYVGSNAQEAPEYSGTTNSSKANVFLDPSGQGAPHENRQPTIYGFYITRKLN